VHETIRRMIDTLVTDLIEASGANIRREKPESIEDVRNAPALIGFSDTVRQEQLALKGFLNEKLYRHYRVARMSSKARRIVTELFDAFLAEPGLLPPEFQARAAEDKPRAIADYVAGMTDRYAMLEHRRLFAIEAS
jgi:dGTPase